MKVCKKCGYEGDFLYCPECGTEMEEIVEEQAGILQEEKTQVMKCPNCGHEGISSFCPACGSAMKTLNPVAEREIVSVTEQKPEGPELIPAPAIEKQELNEAVPKKKSKAKVIIPVFAAVVIIAVIGLFMGSRPEVTSIEAKYNGYTTSGTAVSSESDFKVTATYDDKSQEEVEGWTVEEYTIHPGFNYVDVKYQDKTDTVFIYSPLIADGQYIATVDQIKEVVERYASSNVDGFTGLIKEADLDGVYAFGGINGSKLEIARISFTKKAGDENVGVDGGEIPDTVIVSTMGPSDDPDFDTIFSVAGVGLYSVDPDMTFDESVNVITEATRDALNEGSRTGNVESVRTLSEEKLVSMALLSEKAVMYMYSIQEK